MLIVAGDLHLGQAANLGRLPDQQKAWELLCKVAVEQHADVIGTGDFFHSRKPSSAEFDAFQAGLRILRDGERSLITIAGNHEVVTRDDVCCLEVACAGFDALVIREADVIETEDAAIAFLPWTPGTGNARDTAAALMVLAESMRERGASVLVGHWALSAASLPSGLPILELAEPILDSHRLAELFDVTLCGHIHKRQVVSAEPLVAHVGPLVKGNWGEASIETGAWQIIRVGNASMPLSFLEATPFDIVDRPFISIETDVRGQTRPTDAVLGEIDQWPIRDAIVRVSFQQTSDQVVETAAVLAQLDDMGAWKVDTVTPIIERAASVRSQGISEASDPREAWDTWAGGQEIPESIAELVREEAHERIASVA